jgi:hypothetical protein
MGEEHPLQVARCIPKDPVLAEAARALIPQGTAARGADNIKQMVAKFFVGLGIVLRPQVCSKYTCFSK